jgi:hypothetical protein
VQKLTMILLMLYAFAVPWEYAVDLGEPLGNAARIDGILMLLAVVPLMLLRRRMRAPGAMQWLVLGLYLYFMCSYFWTLDPQTTMEKVRAYFQVMMVIWIAWEVMETPENVRGVVRALVVGCWVLALLTALSYASDSAMATERVRYVAEGMDPNDVARFLDFGFPLATLLFATEESWTMRLLAIGYVPVGLTAVLLTASRGGFTAGLVALLGSAMLLVSWRPRAASAVFAGLTVTAGAVFLYIPGESLARLATIPQEVGGGDLNDRLNIWMAGWHAFAKAPWWGYGAGTYTAAATLSPGDTAHNTVMAVLVTGGVVGLIIFAATMVSVGWAVAKTTGLLRIALGTAFAVWVITSMVGSVEENRMTWLLFALIAVTGRLAMEEPDGLARAFSGTKSAEPAPQLQAVH